MKPLSLHVVVASAFGAAAAGGLIQAALLHSGAVPLLVTFWLAVLFALLACWLLFVGLGIRKLLRREHTWVTAILAGRTALFARAAAPVCGVSAGFLVGVSIVSFTRLSAPQMAHSAWASAISAVAAALACAAACWVEKTASGCPPDSGGQNRAATS